MEAAAVGSNPLLEERWYYSFELAPGVWTKGHEHPNLVLTRELLSGVDLGAVGSAIDVGTQEAAIPVLLKRGGVPSVIAYDRIFRRDRIELVQGALGLEFETIGRIQIRELAGAVRELGRMPLDLVVFSGVLYHMIDPFGGIASMRGLVRDGGLVIVETTTAMTDDVANHLSLGSFGPHTISAPSVRALDAMLGAVGLDPIDAVRFEISEERNSGLPLTRCAVVCRARRDRELPPGVAKPDLDEYIDWEPLASDEPDLTYSPASRRKPIPAKPGGLAKVVKAKPLAIDDRTRIGLDARL